MGELNCDFISVKKALLMISFHFLILIGVLTFSSMSVTMIKGEKCIILVEKSDQ